MVGFGRDSFSAFFCPKYLVTLGELLHQSLCRVLLMGLGWDEDREFQQLLMLRSVGCRSEIPEGGDPAKRLPTLLILATEAIKLICI